MRQAVLVGPMRFRVDDVATPAPGPDEVLVRVLACGACASELHPVEDGYGVPLVIGHEVAGEVVETGPRVAGFRRGDLVTGLFHQGFSDFAVLPSDRVTAVPNGMRPEHAFGEPLACAVSAADRTRVGLGDRIAFVGVGFMGLLMLQLLKLKGPVSITAIDIRDDALAASRRLGADIAIGPEAVDPADRAAKPGDKGGFNVVVEATGTQEGLDLATVLVREHGVLSILGYHQGMRSVDMKLWNFKAMDVLNAHERRNPYRMDCMRRGLALAAAGRIDLASLTTHTFGLDRVGDAFAALRDKPPGFIKSVVLPAT